MSDVLEQWFCPAVEKEIEHGLCWEYCFAGIGGPVTTRQELESWIINSRKFGSLEDFHNVCKNCEHCQWAEQIE